MSKVDTIRAWKDVEYRLSLSAAQLATLPESPAGGFELSDSALDSAVGGSLTGDLIYALSFLGVCTGVDGCRFTYSGAWCGDPAPLF